MSLRGLSAARSSEHWLWGLETFLHHPNPGLWFWVICSSSEYRTRNYGKGAYAGPLSSIRSVSIGEGWKLVLSKPRRGTEKAPISLWEEVQKKFNIISLMFRHLFMYSKDEIAILCWFSKRQGVSKYSGERKKKWSINVFLSFLFLRV